VTPQNEKGNIPVPTEPTPEQLREQALVAMKTSSDKEAQLQQAQSEIEAKELRDALGLDLPFDIDGLIKKGVIEKKGIKVPLGPEQGELYVDMHTLQKAEVILVEQLVEAVFGVMPRNHQYIEARMAATVAMAVTRCNNAAYEVPDPMGNQNDATWKTRWARKLDFYQNVMLKLDDEIINTLNFIYVNLEKADALIDERAKKKS